MAIDPRKLKPTEAARLLNSTPLGEVISERQLHRHRTRAGFRIGDGRSLDLLRYVSWLIEQRHMALARDAESYDSHKQRVAARGRELALLGREIGEIPDVVNPERRAAAQVNFQTFCELYFPAVFHLPWSADHLRVIAKIEDAVLRGGLFAMAMPRGSGKTSLCETACIWAIIYGHREFVALIGADEEHAENMLDSIKVELESNDRLLEDFPEVCFPVRALDGIHQRAAGQLCGGEQTHIGWTARELVLPTIAGSKASGTVMRVAGITGRVRGMKHKRVDGSSIRPSLVLIDDPQTDESARSNSQCATRERLINGAVLGLAGPGRKIAGLMTLTVVKRGDLADRILDREKHPQWQGQRTKMVYTFPSNEALWARYAEMWREGMRDERGTTEATNFYSANREAMDAGAVVAWAARHDPDELSAVQHAMNLRLDRGDAAFWAEFQNEPLVEAALDVEALTVDQIMDRVSGIRRGVAPLGYSTITMFVDVQAQALYWMVVAWRSDFSGHIIDYGTEPEQNEAHFALRDIRSTLSEQHPSAGPGGALLAGLKELSDRMLQREWSSESGSVTRIARCLIDANWGQSTELVYQFCRNSRHAALLTPSHGRYVGASSVPFSEYRRNPGDRVGLNWRVPETATRHALRHVVFDTNYWKSFVATRLSISPGDPGALLTFGHDGRIHRLLAEHLTSEHSIRTEGRGRTVDEWRVRPNGGDNHWLDCLVGCAVAASMQGVSPPELQAKPNAKTSARVAWERAKARAR